MLHPSISVLGLKRVCTVHSLTNVVSRIGLDSKKPRSMPPPRIIATDRAKLSITFLREIPNINSSAYLINQKRDAILRDTISEGGLDGAQATNGWKWHH